MARVTQTRKTERKRTKNIVKIKPKKNIKVEPKQKKGHKRCPTCGKFM